MKMRALSYVVGCSALTFLIACPTVEPPIDDGGVVVDAGDVEPKDGGNPPPPEDGGPPVDPDCGNGTPEGNEECDDGNTSQTDGCKNNCTYNICGDNYVYEGVEECDDYNTTNGDGCSAACLNELPPLPDTVTMSGTFYNRKYTNNQAIQYAQPYIIGVECTNGPCVSDPTYTAADGAYSIGYLPPQSTFTLDIRNYNATADGHPSAYATRVKVSTKAEATETYNPYVVPYAWLQEVATACGVTPNAAYSHVFGQLKTAAGDGVAGVTKDRVQVELAGYLNANPDYVCFLNVDNNALVGTASNVSYGPAGGAFIYFNAKNEGGTGVGTAYVRVAYAAGQTNFAEQSIGLQANNVGLVTLYTDDNPNPVIDQVYFTDVLQILQAQGCTGCHTEGGAGDAQVGGYYARFDLTPQEVYDNLTGPGTNCTVTDYVGNYRVCVNDPSASRLLRRPLLEQDGNPDHPNASFADENDVNYRTLYAWIEQGAQFYVPVEPPPDQVYTLTGVMNVASVRGCTSCHRQVDNGNGTYGRPAGNLDLYGCEQYYIDNGTYADNAVDYDSATNPDYYKRDCVYYHLKNSLVADDPYYGEQPDNDNNGTAGEVGDGRRVNLDYPEHSMLLRNPYCGPLYCAEDAYPETHPVKVFANTDDPGYTAIHSWIAGGALNDGDADTYYLTQ